MPVKKAQQKPAARPVAKTAAKPAVKQAPKPDASQSALKAKVDECHVCCKKLEQEISVLKLENAKLQKQVQELIKALKSSNNFSNLRRNL
jgi:hypothetical protein